MIAKNFQSCFALFCWLAQTMSKRIMRDPACGFELFLLPQSRLALYFSEKELAMSICS